MSCDKTISPLPNTLPCVKECLEDPLLDCGSRKTAPYIKNAKQACLAYDLESLPSECCEFLTFGNKALCAQKCMETDDFSNVMCLNNVKHEITEYCGTNSNEKCCSSAEYRELNGEDICQEAFPIKYNLNIECQSNGNFKFTSNTNKISETINCQESPLEQTIGYFDFKCLKNGSELEVKQNNYPGIVKKTKSCKNENNSDDSSENTFKVNNNDGEIDITCGNKTQKITCENNKTTTTTKNCGPVFWAGFGVCFILVILLVVVLRRNGQSVKKSGFSLGFKL